MSGIRPVFNLSKELLKVKTKYTAIILLYGHSETVSPEIAKEAGIREYLCEASHQTGNWQKWSVGCWIRNTGD